MQRPVSMECPELRWLLRLKKQGHRCSTTPRPSAQLAGHTESDGSHGGVSLGFECGMGVVSEWGRCNEWFLPVFGSNSGRAC